MQEAIRTAPRRSCLLRDGRLKFSYPTFDEAWHAVMHNREGKPYRGEWQERLHPYRCPEHGWHIGHGVSC